MNDSSEVNRQIVFEHSKSPRNWGELKNPSHQCLGHNPNCSDNFRIFLKVSPQTNIIEELRFQASGSALNKASGSIMSTVVKGKTVEEALSLFDEFHEMALGNLDPEKTQNHLGKLAIFSGINEHPSRVKCATLAWHALKGALENRQEAVLDIDVVEGSHVIASEEIHPDDELDLKGVKCPINFVRVKVRLSKMTKGQQLKVILDEGEPIRNVPRSLEMEGHRILLREPLSGGACHAIIVEK